MASMQNDGNAVERSGAPPFSFLLPPPDGTVSTGTDQWLWYFYLTSWTRPFFPHMSTVRRPKSGGEGSMEKGRGADSVLSFEESLAVAGFPAADLIAAYEAQWKHLSQKTEAADVRTKALTGVKDDGVYPPLPRVAESYFGRAFRALAVNDYLSASSSSSLSSHLEELVQQSLCVARQRCQKDAKDETVKTEKDVIQSALQAMLSPEASTAQYPLLLSVESTTSADDSDVGKKRKREEDVEEDKLTKEAHRARLFAALTMEAFSRVKKVCASMLLAYVNAAFGKMAKARACGVVVGIVEYAIASRYYREDGTGRCPLSAAALLLCALVEMQDTVTRETEKKEDEDGVSGGLFATLTVTCLQELLFAAVVGGAVAPHRLSPIASAAKEAPKPAGKVIGRNNQQQQQQQQNLSFQMTVRPLVTRALALHEVDALLQVFLPALLQQVGFEWPWSESLRRARVLDKVQPERVTIAEGVRLNSRAVFEELLAAVGRRTYVSRFQNILPQSYEQLFVAAFPTVADNDNAAPEEDEDDVGGRGKSNVRQTLFVLPPYYQAAGEALIEFFENSGLAGTTARETERVLVRHVGVQPMIVQLQALGNRTDNNNGNGDDGTHSTDDEDLLSTTRLSEDEKHKLVLRYRCEVLLASLMVYTQLQTVSLVQQLMRQLAPLFEKLLLPLMQERTLRRSFVVRRRHDSLNGGNSSEEGTIDFTPEFKVLMDDIHYEFYPLEWIPEAMNMQLQRQTSESDASLPAFYSAFAAVAYQFGLVLHGSPQGLRGGDDTDYKVRLKAYRFFHLLLLNTLVDAVSSSCELEGAMALAATRRVGGTHRNNDNNNTANNDSVEAQQLQQCGAASFHAVVNPHDVILALAQCLLPPDLVSRPQPAMVVNVESQRPSEEWLRRVIDWVRSTKTRWTMQMQTVEGPTAPLASLPNSMTFDAVPLAREVIRGVRRRLLEKLHVKQVNCIKGHSNSPDLLLQQHLLSLQALLENIALQPQNLSKERAVMFSAARLLWSSPLFSRELQLCGHLDCE